MCASLAPASVLIETDRGFVALRPRLVDRIRIRLRAGTLDTRLAAGEAPEGDRALSLRAVAITTPSARQALARAWESLVDRAGRPAHPLDPRVAPAREQVADSGAEIGILVDLLRARRPVAAQGVARAAALLATACSPAYRRGSPPGALAAAVTGAIDML